jgi:putative DNA methylase
LRIHGGPHFFLVIKFYRRRLPHLQIGDQPVFLTWRLYGSLPQNRMFAPQLTAGRAFVAMDQLLDRVVCGPLHLSRPEIATLGVDAIRYGEDQLKHYRLHAWVVMANHFHLLITPLVDLAKLTHSLKRFIARRANERLGLTGQPFWQDESYDHLVRDRAEFDRVLAYIENNPVRAGLVAAPDEFIWSSAGRPIENRPAG